MINLKSIIKKIINNKLYLEILVPILIASFVFIILSYRLDFTSLHPWDEAWYASITQNLVSNNRFLDISYNGLSFWDHPPLGFYFMYVSYHLFGNNEFATRLPSVLFSCLSVVLIYLFGKKIGGYHIGIQSAVILFSSRWFLLRARTGNLDIQLVFFQLLTFSIIYFAKTWKGIAMAWFVLGLALLSKTTISLVMVPILLFSTIRIYKLQKYNLRHIMLFVFALILPLIPWYGYNLIIHGLPFIRRNIFAVGMRNGGGGISVYSTNLFIMYLRSMIHKWFYPLLISLGLGLIFVKKKSISYVLSYFFLIALPLFASGQAAIWHMIPLIAPMSLLIPLIINEIITRVESYQLVTKYKMSGLLKISSTVVIIIIAVHSWKAYYLELFVDNKYPSTPKVLAQASRELPGYVIIDEFNDYSPTINYYANKNTVIMRDLPDKMVTSLTQKPFILITNESNADIAINTVNGCQVKFRYENYFLVSCK